jgi:hypothetical protein
LSECECEFPWRGMSSKTELRTRIQTTNLHKISRLLDKHVKENYELVDKHIALPILFTKSYGRRIHLPNT